MSAVRGYAEMAAVLRYDDGASTPTFGDLEEAAVLLAGVAATLPEGVTVEQVVAENEMLRADLAYETGANTWLADERLKAITALLPTCPACGGTGEYDELDETGTLETYDCPDCDHGKVKVAQLAATWQAVHTHKRMFGMSELPGATRRFSDPDGILPFLRSVRPPSPKEGT